MKENTHCFYSTTKLSEELGFDEKEIKKWLNTPSLGRITHSNNQGKYQINERWIPKEEKIRNEIINILKQVEESISRSEMIKKYGLKRKLHTITPIIDELDIEGIIENTGTDRRPKYRLKNLNQS